MFFNLLYKSVTFKSIFLLFIFIIFIIGLIDYLLINGRNGCEMTFMFQFPQFVLIPLKNQINLKYPNYNLYIYGEGLYAESLRSGHIRGTPIIFVPGNRGSYKQVRSLGSVAQRMADKYQTDFHLNYFTLDFNEEYSGINSIELESQTLFLKECVIKIIDLYEKRGRHISLVLIGHSIGGLIIRSLLTLPEFETYINRIDLIITLATPHKYPVVPIDSKMISFYEKVEDFWKLKRNETLNHINLISISGGFEDKLVPSELTRLQTQHFNDMSIVTTAIDDVWVSTDHLCIVWCKQLVLKITRLLFDLIDKKTQNIMENNNERNKIIKYHLINRTLDKSYPKFFIPEYNFQTINENWSQNFERIIKISKPKILKQNYILLPFVRRESIVIQFKGLYKHDWLSACSASKQNNITFCEKGLTLHSYVKRMPSKPQDSERRIFKAISSVFINKGFTHLLLALSPTIEPVNLQIDRFTTAIRSKTILMPTLMQSLTMIFSPVTVLSIAISEETTYYNLSLVGLNHIWNTYWISLDTKSCYPSASNIGYIYLSIPWNKENQFKYVYPKRGMSSQMTLKLNSPKPKDFDDSKDPILYLIVDPNCSYELHLKPSISEIMGQILRHFGVILLPIVVSILLSVLSIQILIKQSTVNQISGNFSTTYRLFYDKSLNILKNFGSVSIFGLLVISSASYGFYSTTTITSNLTNTRLLFLFSFLYLISHSICYFFLVIISLIFISFSTVFDYIQQKLNSSHLESPIEKMEKSFRIKTIPTLSAILVAISGIIYVSALSFILCLIAHTLQLIYLCKKCRSIENRSGVDLNCSLWNLHLTLLVLIFVSTVPTIPLLLDWLNLKMPVLYYGLNDPFMIPGAFLIISCHIIWHQYSVTDINANQRKYLSFGLKIGAILSSIFCQINYWNISLFMTISIFVVSAQQLFEWISNRNLKCD